MEPAGATRREMFDRPLFGVSPDEPRFTLPGVLRGGGGGGVLRMVATDGHRLAKVDRRVPGPKPERGVIMPRKGLGEARKLLEEADQGDGALLVSVKEGRLSTPTVSFFMRLAEARLPDCRQ